MKMIIRFLILAMLPFYAFSQDSAALISRIAFGSCAHQDEHQPILDLVVKHKPDVFIYLGDNIYADTDDMLVMKAKYDSLAAKPEYQRLQKSTRIIATWDDHDFGWNDGGKYYPKKEASKKLFLDFFKEPANSQRRTREGIYTSYYFTSGGRTIQIILLDVRTFRSNQRIYRGELNDDEKFFYPLEYYPLEIPDSTMLGNAQWSWLEKELNKPADLRIIGSGSQFGITFNGYESWANYPMERDKMLDIIRRTKASGVLFLTGDVHYAEISRLRADSLYPIYDVTASGITSTWLFATPNQNRIEGPVMDNHFGLLTIDWKKKDPDIKMQIYDVSDNQRIEYTIRLSEIGFR